MGVVGYLSYELFNSKMEKGGENIALEQFTKIRDDYYKKRLKYLNYLSDQLELEEYYNSKMPVGGENILLEQFTNARDDYYKERF